MNVTLPRLRETDFRVTAPPSKSFTHRGLIIAALAEGESVIENPLDSGDIRVTCRALETLGVPVRISPGRIHVQGVNGQFHAGGEVSIDMENSGTSIRLLAPLGLLCDAPVIFTGSARMQERPIGPLVDALNGIGGEIRYLNREKFPPIRTAGSLAGGNVSIPGSVSSQFISALMISAPYAASDTCIRVTGPIASRSYLDITAWCMEAFGVVPRCDGYREILVSQGKQYQGRKFVIEGDYSSASYFFAIAAVCGGSAEVSGLNPDSVQGDRAFLDALARMGCRVTYMQDRVHVRREGDLVGITIDMSSSPDTVQTLCMVAAAAITPSRITGISHLKYKESDRIRATADLINNLGGDARVTDDSIEIVPAPLHGGVIDPGDDHRTAMSAAVLALARGDITITHAECVEKSFPRFFDVVGEIVGT